MTRKSFAGKENVRHFRLVQRPLSSDDTAGNSGDSGNTKMLSFDEMFEEYNPNGFKPKEQEQEHFEHDISEHEDYDFVNDEDGEMVDIDAELDRFTEEFIDIEGEDGIDRIKEAVAAGEAAKYGILLDDRDYDYTKHLRQVGVTPGAVFIQAPGMKKVGGAVNSEKTRDLFSAHGSQESYDSNDTQESHLDQSLLKANHEAARQQYRALLQQVSDDSILKEVIEALEDDRYVTDEFDDELVISLDKLNIKSDNINSDVDVDDFFNDDDDVDILNENEEFPDFIPSEASKGQAHTEFEEILNEYEDDEEESVDNEEDSSVYNTRRQVFVDIEGDYDNENENQSSTSELNEEAEEIYKYLKEHGRARGTTLYDKKRPNHLPPIHIAIAQYNELRRELAVNNDLIIQKYSGEDEDESRRQMRESERIIGEMVKIIDDPEEMDKRLNIETAKYLLKLSDNIAAPKKIIESTTTRPKDKERAVVSESESELEEELPRVNKGVARSTSETLEEKKARKAEIKAEKREKRAIKSEKRK